MLPKKQKQPNSGAAGYVVVQVAVQVLVVAQPQAPFREKRRPDWTGWVTL